MRVQSFDIIPQNILTKASVILTFHAVIFNRVNDPEKAVLNVVQYHIATQLFTITTLRTILEHMTSVNY